MATALVVSNRGQVTLRMAPRERLAIKSGGVVIVEDRRSETVLKPAVVVELDFREDDQIAQWDTHERFAAAVAADPGTPVRDRL